MEDINGIQSYVINGYLFSTRAEYDKAVQEKKGINYLNAQLDVNNTDKVYKLYTELIEKQIFVTPIGMDYLKLLRKTILNNENYKESDILPIPVVTATKQEKERVEKYISTRYEKDIKDLKNKDKKVSGRFMTSLILNIVLIIVIGVLFYLTTTSSHPNLINYERKLQDKYASWEEDLKQREQELKDYEWELKQRDENSQN